MDEEFYYVTKWALTSGVLMIPRDKARVSGRMLFWGKWDAVYGNDWHETRASAEARVAEMKERRRASLLKSLEQLDRPVKYQECVDAASTTPRYTQADHGCKAPECAPTPCNRCGKHIDYDDARRDPKNGEPWCGCP